MEKKKGTSPGMLAFCGLGICVATAVTWASRGYPNALDIWAIGVGTVMFIAGLIVAAAKS